MPRVRVAPALLGRKTLDGEIARVREVVDPAIPDREALVENEIAQRSAPMARC